MKLTDKQKKNFKKKFTTPEDGCWLWTAAETIQGDYGMFMVYNMSTAEKKTEHAHRVAWTLAYGDIPPNITVSHRCTNTKCVRPEHLVLKSVSEVQQVAGKVRRIRSLERKLIEVKEALNALRNR